MRAPVSRSRPLFWLVVRLVVGDHPLVGHLRLLGESAFGVQNRAVGAPDPSSCLGVFRGAGF
jgi:hypothetical protein